MQLLISLILILK